jgi:hypothetical protein
MSFIESLQYSIPIIAVVVLIMHIICTYVPDEKE